MFTPLLMKRVAGLGMEENKFVAGWTAFEDRLRGRKLLLGGLAQTTTRAQLLAELGHGERSRLH